MKGSSKIRTRRWTRSPRGQVLGVATGLAEWRGFPPDVTRLIVFLSILFTGFFPGAIIYLLIAIILPEQRESDVIQSFWDEGSSQSYTRDYDCEDVSYKNAEKSTEDLKKEYENLKKKVEKMENEMFDRESDWDSRFNSEDKK